MSHEGRLSSYMVVVSKRKGETKDSMFRKFSKTFFEENVVDEVRKRQYYKKPSLQKKEHEKERLKKRFSKKRPLRMIKW